MEAGLFWLIIQGDSLYHQGSEGEAVGHITYTKRKQREIKSTHPIFIWCRTLLMRYLYVKWVFQYQVTQFRNFFKT